MSEKVMVVMAMSPELVLLISLPRLTVAGKRGYANRTALNGAGGLCKPYSSGAEASRRQVRGFFYALSSVMAGSVWGGREACRTQSPVCKPDTLSAALSFATSVGGLQPLLWSHS